MLRIHEVCVKKEENSRATFSDIQQSIEYVMRRNASAIKYKIAEEENQLRVFLERPISFQTLNKILLVFDDKRMRIMKVTLERKELGAFIRGHLEIIVS